MRTSVPGFVGRSDERSCLVELAARAVAGSGGLALVLGEPGMGKSRLLTAAVSDLDVPVLWATGREGGGGPPLWLWRQVARDARQAGWADLDAVIADGGAGREIGSGQDRFRRFDAIGAALADAGRAQPAVIVLDDLHWADPESRALLDFLASDLSRLPVAVLAAARPDELGPPPRAELTLELHGLRGEDLRALVATVIGAEPTTEVVEAAAEHTDGNPLFVGEVGRLLAASGHAADPARWRGVVPEGVRSVISRRFARLPEATFAVLGAAAVLGMEWDLLVLAAIVELDRDATYDRLAPALDAGLLHDRGDGRLAFTHALIRDAAAADVGSARRRELHERAATLLEVLHGEGAAAAIAVHRSAAGDRTGAATWAERAGAGAIATGMYAEAAAWFERSVASLDEPPPSLLVRWGDALSRCGRLGDAERVFADAAREARRAGDAECLARAALGVGTLGGGFEVRLLDAAQIALLREALDELNQRDSVTRALLLARLSVATTLQDGADHRGALADEAVAMARRLGDPGALAHGLAAWCDAHAGPADIDARAVAATEMLTAAVASGDPELELLAHRFLIVAHLEMGDVARARREIQTFARIADGLRQPQFQWYARVEEAMLAFLAGDLDEAERLARLAASLGEQAGSANAEMLATGAVLPVIARERGDRSMMVETFGVNNNHPEATRAVDLLTFFTVGYGAAEPEVRAALRSLPEDPCEMMSPDDGLFLQTVTMVGTAVAFVGDPMRLEVCERLLADHADRFVLDGTGSVVHGPVRLTLARMAAAGGRAEEALAHYDAAAGQLRRVGGALLLDTVLVERARVASGRHWSDPSHDAAAAEGALAAASVTAFGGDHDGDHDAVFRREGDTWLVAYDGASTRLRHAKGMMDLAALLRRPGVEIHVFDLVAATDGADGRGTRRASGDLGPALDAGARRAYEARIHELTEDIEEAEQHNDFVRAERLDDERAQLLTELAGALGLGGRARPQGSDVERARKAVGMRVADAIRRVDTLLPPLAAHLRSSVHTGTYCVYRPERPVRWS